MIVTLPGSIVLFIHFFKSYFSRYNLVFIKYKSLVILYTFYCVYLLIMTVLIPLFGFNSIIINTILLIFSLFLIVFLLLYLTRFYLPNKNSDIEGILKILLVYFIFSF